MEDEGRESTEQHAERTYTRKGIFAYDYATKKTENISSGDITDYTVDEVSQTLYYYVFNNGLYKRKLSDSKAERNTIKWYENETNIMTSFSFATGKLFII